MIYLKLFLTFMKIGAVSFGGGYAMIPLIREECLAYGWMTEETIMNFIAVAESTPGPIAVNMATFVGSSQAGIWGSLVATVGLALPSFVIILIIAALIKNLIKFAGVQAALSGVKPVVIGLILATSATMFLSVILGVSTISGGMAFDPWALGILAVLAGVAMGYQKLTKKKISPILLILLSAVLGMIIY